MTFITNPYKVLTLFVVDVYGNFKWVCSSCGQYSKQTYTPETEVRLIHSNFKAHVIEIHNISPQDVENWSLGI